MHTHTHGQLVSKRERDCIHYLDTSQILNHNHLQTHTLVYKLYRVALISRNKEGSEGIRIASEKLEKEAVHQIRSINKETKEFPGDKGACAYIALECIYVIDHVESIDLYEFELEHI